MKPDTGWRRWIPVEPPVLAALALMAGLLLVLVNIAEDVVEKETGVFDRSILLALRTTADPSIPIGPHWLEESMKAVTSLGSTTLIALTTVIAALYLLVAGRMVTAMLVAVSVSSGALVEQAMKAAFDRARPAIVPHLVAVDSLSFPSGHAMLSAMAYLSLGALLARAQRQWRTRVFVLATGVVLTMLISFSRVYLGVHWPTDVLAGWTAGSIWALAFWLIAERFGHHPPPQS